MASEILDRLRLKFMIPPRWRIDLEITCPRDMPNALGSMGWEYLPNASYFLRLRCDTPEEMMEWIIAHELLEALMAPYANLTVEEINRSGNKELCDLKHVMHGDIRNEIIESLLPVILGYPRPA
jgi:hypothetical protein